MLSTLEAQLQCKKIKEEVKSCQGETHVRAWTVFPSGTSQKDLGEKKSAIESKGMD